MKENDETNFCILKEIGQLPFVKGNAGTFCADIYINGKFVVESRCCISPHIRLDNYCISIFNLPEEYYAEYGNFCKFYFDKQSQLLRIEGSSTGPKMIGKYTVELKNLR